MKLQVVGFVALIALVACQETVKEVTGESAEEVEEKGADNRSPVTRVVHILEDLKSKLISDQKREEQMYNKFACWCEKTSHRKAEDINAAIAELKALGQTILKLKGKIATLESEIEELEDKIQKAGEMLEEATAIRAKQNKEFMAESEETKMALVALQRAIRVLVQGTKNDEQFLQTDAATQLKLQVRTVLDKMPSNVQISSEHAALLSEFVTSGAAANYAPQSTTIQGILTDMYANFGKSLQEATQTEAKQNREYEELKATLETKIIDMTEAKQRREDSKAEAESDLADATAKYDDTQAQKEADVKFFDEMKKNCDATHKEWEERKELRMQEMMGVEKALGFLTSDDARELFAKSIKPGVEAEPKNEKELQAEPSFLQTSSDDAQALSLKAYNVLKSKATKTKSLRLAQLAVSVRSAKYGHFKEVIEEIDHLIQVLKDEGADDQAKKDQCEEENHQIELAVNDLTWKMKNNDATIQKLDEQIEQLEKEAEDTRKQMQETMQHMHEITETRHEEHEEFEHSQHNDAAAIELIGMARDALTQYYKQNNITLGKLQLVQEDPTFNVSKDQAPDVDFSGKGSRKLVSKNAVSLMTMIMQDLSEEIQNDRADEERAQEEYEAEMLASKNLFKELSTKEVNIKETIAKKETEREEEEKDHHNNAKELDEQMSYKNQITPDCSWIKKNFDDRAEARAAEMDGLSQAKDFLAGMKASFVQIKSAPVKPHTNSGDKLAGVKFLGLQ